MFGIDRKYLNTRRMAVYGALIAIAFNWATVLGTIVLALHLTGLVELDAKYFPPDTTPARIKVGIAADFGGLIFYVMVGAILGAIIARVFNTGGEKKLSK